MSHRSHLIYVVALLAALFSIHAAHAYEIRPKPKMEHIGQDPIHEAMTAASLSCALDTPNTVDDDDVVCNSHYRNLRALWQRYEVGTLFRAEEAHFANNVVAGSRWPDDPQRALTNALTIPKWAEVAATCRNRTFPWAGSCANPLCQSHYGNLQIWHAMKPARPWCDNSSSFGCDQQGDDATVLADIRAWANFLTGVATGKISLDDPLLSHGDSWFDGTCSKVYPPERTVRDYFRVSCTGSSNVVQATLCDSLPLADNEVRAVALGALLHLVQDSYSRSHVYREGSEGSCPTATISCGRPLGFYDYSVQSGKAHKTSDQWPTWSSNCDIVRDTTSVGGVTDPITAGAALIRLAQVKNREEMNAYLNRRILPDLPAGRGGELEHCLSAEEPASSPWDSALGN